MPTISSIITARGGVQGPQGVQGSIGSTGAQGAQGAQGPQISTSNIIFTGRISENVVVLGNSNISANINLASGTVFTANLTGNATFTLSNAINASSVTLVLTNDHVAGRSVAWSGGTFLFPGGAASLSRTTTASARDVWVFFTPNNGVTWIGNIVMKNLST